MIKDRITIDEIARKAEDLNLTKKQFNVDVL